jgi:hypothetical protein
MFATEPFASPAGATRLHVEPFQWTVKLAVAPLVASPEAQTFPWPRAATPPICPVPGGSCGPAGQPPYRGQCPDGARRCRQMIRPSCWA